MIVKERDCVETRAANVKRKSADPTKALSANLKRQRKGKKVKCISPKETDDESENAQIRSLSIQPRYINTLESSNRASDVRIHLSRAVFRSEKSTTAELAPREKENKKIRARARTERRRNARRAIFYPPFALAFCVLLTETRETYLGHFCFDICIRVVNVREVLRLASGCGRAGAFCSAHRQC
jgi:hypothetical protein